MASMYCFLNNLSRLMGVSMTLSFLSCRQVNDTLRLKNHVKGNSESWKVLLALYFIFYNLYAMEMGHTLPQGPF